MIGNLTRVEAKEDVLLKYEYHTQYLEKHDALKTLYGFFKGCLEQPSEHQLAAIADYFDSVQQYLTKAEIDDINKIYQFFYTDTAYNAEAIFGAKEIKEEPKRVIS